MIQHNILHYAYLNYIIDCVVLYYDVLQYVYYVTFYHIILCYIGWYGARL